MPEQIRFFQPGPAYVLESTRQAMTRPVVAHRSPEFKALYAALAERLPRLLRTVGEVYIATGSATLVMELAVLSTVERRVLCLTNGAFSERWFAICQSLGKQADRLAVPWGEAVDPDAVRRALRRAREAGVHYEAVTMVHCETSTGVLAPLAELARAVREESDALVLADVVSSLGGAPVEADLWGLDVAVAGVQKAMAVPPGLVLLTMSERAEAAAERQPRRGFYTDLLRYRDQHRQGGPITTPAVPVVYALDEQLDRILAEGLEARWARHAALRQHTLEWAAERGLECPAQPPHRSPTVTCLRMPQGHPAPELVRAAAAAGFTLGPGYGAWKQDTFRIGHMGEVRRSDLEALFAALAPLLP